MADVQTMKMLIVLALLTAAVAAGASPMLFFKLGLTVLCILGGSIPWFAAIWTWREVGKLVALGFAMGGVAADLISFGLLSILWGMR